MENKGIIEGYIHELMSQYIRALLVVWTRESRMCNRIYLQVCTKNHRVIAINETARVV